jgi:hypothetical protein
VQVGRDGEWVFVCRCEQCGELWCRLVQAGMWKVRTREYDFKSFIKRIVSELTLGQLHNTIGYIYTGSGHKLSV